MCRRINTSHFNHTCRNVSLLAIHLAIKVGDSTTPLLRSLLFQNELSFLDFPRLRPFNLLLLLVLSLHLSHNLCLFLCLRKRGSAEIRLWFKISQMLLLLQSHLLVLHLPSSMLNSLLLSLTLLLHHLLLLLHPILHHLHLIHLWLLLLLLLHHL